MAGEQLWFNLVSAEQLLCDPGWGQPRVRAFPVCQGEKMVVSQGFSKEPSRTVGVRRTQRRCPPTQPLGCPSPGLAVRLSGSSSHPPPLLSGPLGVSHCAKVALDVSSKTWHLCQLPQLCTCRNQVTLGAQPAPASCWSPCYAHVPGRGVQCHHPTQVLQAQ